MLLVMVSFSRMRSPIGSNALHCCQWYGARANDISIINFGIINRYVRYRYSDELISRASALLEFIFIRDHSFKLSGWDIQDINYMLFAICREWVVFVFHSSRLIFFSGFISLHILCISIRVRIIIIYIYIYIHIYIQLYSPLRQQHNYNNKRDIYIWLVYIWLYIYS